MPPKKKNNSAFLLGELNAPTLRLDPLTSTTTSSDAEGFSFSLPQARACPLSPFQVPCVLHAFTLVPSRSLCPSHPLCPPSCFPRAPCMCLCHVVDRPSLWPLQYVRFAEKKTLWCAYWAGLGILSSVGLGTGLHTFLLYLVR